MTQADLPSKMELALQVHDFRVQCSRALQALRDSHERRVLGLKSQITRLNKQIASLNEALGTKQLELNAWQLLTPRDGTLNISCSVPRPMVAASRSGEGLPRISGIYFVWSDMTGSVCVYVGQSVCIANRARLNSNDRRSDGNIHCDDFISWLPASEEELDYAEAFYIGLLRPARNRKRRRARLEA